MAGKTRFTRVMKFDVEATFERLAFFTNFKNLW